ncbi:MAG: PTS glucitol/sorbitol transporter subunit IIA [Eubacteriaceae bacterium]|nr:PTS glucitol/sorbitol transporter subunit IIA [Eubacteriaceae bacterium]
MRKEVYRTTVKHIGPEVEAFGGEMMILFGDNAPDALREYCYTIDINKPEGDILPGQTLSLDGEAYAIQSVGEAAQKNLTQLGHLTVVFTGNEKALLPGAIVVENKPKQSIKVGTVIQIMA